MTRTSRITLMGVCALTLSFVQSPPGLAADPRPTEAEGADSGSKTRYPVRVSDEPPLPDRPGWQAVLLPRRHGLGTVPPASIARRPTLSPRPRREAVHGDPGGRPGRARRAGRAQPLRPPAAGEQGPGPARRGLLPARRLTWSTVPMSSAWSIGMLPTWGDKWNKSRARAGDLHARERGVLRRVPRQALQGQADHLDPRRRPPRRERPAEGDHPGDGRRPEEGRRRPPPDDLPPDRRPNSSADWFHDEDWLAFNMLQSGHGYNHANYDRIAADYARKPAKPCLDGEPGYEDHPAEFKAKNGYLDDYDDPQVRLLGAVRRRLRPHLRLPRHLAVLRARRGRRSPPPAPPGARP